MLCTVLMYRNLTNRFNSVHMNVCVCPARYKHLSSSGLGICFERHLSEFDTTWVGLQECIFITADGRYTTSNSPWFSKRFFKDRLTLLEIFTLFTLIICSTRLLKLDGRRPRKTEAYAWSWHGERMTKRREIIFPIRTKCWPCASLTH